MMPLVIDELRNDLACFGNCTYSVTDNEYEFAIKRYNPEEVFYTLELM